MQEWLLLDAGELMRGVGALKVGVGVISIDLWHLRRGASGEGIRLYVTDLIMSTKTGIQQM